MMKTIDLILLEMWAQTVPTTPGGAVAFKQHSKALPKGEERTRC